MLTKLSLAKTLVGNTPLVPLHDDRLNLYAKLEGYNYSGSIKDRPALKIIEEGIKSGKIGPNTTIIESSSGNFAIALAHLCNLLGITFIPVIDRFTNAENERILHVFCDRVIKIMETDETGGCLLNRIRKIKSMLEEIPDAFWPNQYANPLNPRAHYEGTASEICDELESLDAIFISVSSGGSVTGISQRIKEKFPTCKVVAVDAVGSVIFGGPPRRRPIPGMGSSMRPDVLNHAEIDEVVYVDEYEVINNCHQLLEDHGLFLGGSSGAAYAAAQKFDYSFVSGRKPTVAIICPDLGKVYMNNVFNPAWVAKLKESEKVAVN